MIEIILFTFNKSIGAGDIGFDEREILRDTTHLDETLYKSHDLSSVPIESRDKTLGNSTSMEKSMDVDLEPPVGEDGFGGTVGDAFMGRSFLQLIVVFIFKFDVSVTCSVLILSF